VVSGASPRPAGIDEAHERGSTDWENRTLTNIIDHRYDAMRCTLLLSNQSKEQFAESVGPSVTSRILETGEAIICNWPSFRPTKVPPR
jgi:DNA replication protein DnaC